MHLHRSTDQGAKHHGRRTRVVQGGVGGRHVEAQLLNQPRKPRGLPLGEIEHQPGQGRGVDDRMLERALEPPTDEPRVESVVAVLDENGTLCEAQECSACVPELRRADQHRAVDVVSLLGVRVDGRAAVDESVEEGQRTRQLESLGAQLEHQERSIARGLNVDGDELGIVQRRLRTQLRRVDGDLLPLHRLRGSTRLEVNRLHEGLLSSAARRNWISSRVIVRNTTTATA
ncbi:MAG: hypothetical protein M3082_15330 [Candidatus Dormibacteraeota bacterium]|nr:hypothetical protein [Candidatus Dormibacteraeota bacterium]